MLLGHLNVFTERSPEELALIDLKEGRLVEQKHPVQLSPDIISRLNLIKQGEFVEQGGAPAIRLLAHVTSPLPLAPPEIVRGFVSDSALMKNFVKRLPVAEPGQYFLAAVNSSSDWLPMFRWLREASISREQAAQLIDNEGLTPSKRARALGRLAGSRSAYVPASSSIKPTRDRLLALDAFDISSNTDLRRIMSAIRAVKAATADQIQTLCTSLERGFDYAWATSKGGDLQSYVKAAASRIDELQADPIINKAVNAA